MRQEFKAKIDQYTTKLRNAEQAEVAKIRSEFSDWYYALTESERDEIRPFWKELKDRARQTIAEIKEALSELQQLQDVRIVVEGAEYDLHEWITISEYSRIHNLKVSRVQNWITRGVVPRNKVLAIPQLNHIKLIKNEVYTKV
jgi:predicted transcriptional regulator